MSDYSTGVVQDEILLRLLVAPTHMHNKRVEPRASCLTEAETSGLSLLRKEQATDDEIKAVARGLVERARKAFAAKAGVFGVLELSSSAVRQFKWEGDDSNCYCIYDTAEAETPSHVESFQQIYGIVDEVRTARRTGLFNAVKSKFISVRDFRNGLLLDLAPLQSHSI